MVAILIDGGYFLKRLPTIVKDAKPGDPESVARALHRLIASHLHQLIHGVVPMKTT